MGSGAVVGRWRGYGLVSFQDGHQQWIPGRWIKARRIKTAVQRMASRGNEDNLEVPVAVTAQLSLARKHPRRHVKAPVPTWGQISLSLITVKLFCRGVINLLQLRLSVTAAETIVNHTGHTFQIPHYWSL